MFAIKALTRLPLSSLAGSYKGIYFFAGTLPHTAAKTVNLPFLADSINEGTVAELLKSNLNP